MGPRQKQSEEAFGLQSRSCRPTKRVVEGKDILKRPCKVRRKILNPLRWSISKRLDVLMSALKSSCSSASSLGLDSRSSRSSRCISIEAHERPFLQLGLRSVRCDAGQDDFQRFREKTSGRLYSDWVSQPDPRLSFKGTHFFGPSTYGYDWRSHATPGLPRNCWVLDIERRKRPTWTCRFDGRHSLFAEETPGFRIIQLIMSLYTSPPLRVSPRWKQDTPLCATSAAQLPAAPLPWHLKGPLRVFFKAWKTPWRLRVTLLVQASLLEKKSTPGHERGRLKQEVATRYH